MIIQTTAPVEAKREARSHRVMQRDNRLSRVVTDCHVTMNDRDGEVR